MQQTSQSLQPTPPWRRPAASDATLPSTGPGGPTQASGSDLPTDGVGLASPEQQGQTGQPGPTDGSGPDGLPGPKGRFKSAPVSMGPPPNKIRGDFANMNRPPPVPTVPLLPDFRHIMLVLWYGLQSPL